MSRFSNPEGALAWLDRIPMFGAVGASAALMGLQSMDAICEQMDRPEARLKGVHVAGTNGKGTTCRLLASVGLEAGYRVGLYTSPHLLRVHERIRIGESEIPDSAILEWVNRFSSDADRLSLTYFEVTTAMALWYFDREACDWVVLETGLGGRLDATNITRLDPCVITSIGLDHTDFLGDTLAKIAREKAGILKGGETLITGKLPAEAMEMIDSIVRDRQVRWIQSGRTEPHWEEDRMVWSDPVDGAEWSVRGENRKRIDLWNVAMSWEVATDLESRFSGLRKAFVKGVEKMNEHFPLQASFRRLRPDRHWYIDGAHNTEAVDSLVEQIDWLRSRGVGGEPVIVLSLMKDKATPDLLSRYRSFRDVRYWDGQTPRTAPWEWIHSRLPQATRIDPVETQRDTWLDSLKTELVIFAGSFYFYSKVLQWIACQPPSDQTNRSETDS
ncbi:MAG: bifunctional folylpolyglutamate synthase/dihydrofolate synthase [Bacteroidota bacterium]